MKHNIVEGEVIEVGRSQNDMRDSNHSHIKIKRDDGTIIDIGNVFCDSSVSPQLKTGNNVKIGFVTVGRIFGGRSNAICVVKNSDEVVRAYPTLTAKTSIAFWFSAVFSLFMLANTLWALILVVPFFSFMLWIYTMSKSFDSATKKLYNTFLAEGNFKPVIRF